MLAKDSGPKKHWPKVATDHQVAELEAHLEDEDGWCTTCAKWTRCGGTEPDAEDYPCEECGFHTVQGALNTAIEAA